jgi:pimeloyl-ACP methyl ester carboxylesterase
MRRLRKILGWTFGVLFAVIFVTVTGCVAHANYRISRDETEPYDAHAPGRYFTVQGHRLHVQTIGDPGANAGRRPLLLIHGFVPSGHLSFLPWARESLANDRPLILPDNLGYGFSERIPRPGDHYSMRSYARDLAGILDQLGVQQVDVAGHSWGGVIAAQFAHDYPERVRRLVIVDGGFFHLEKGSTAELFTYLPLGMGRSLLWHLFGGGPGSYVWRICRAARNCEQAAPIVRIKDATDTTQAMMRTSRALDSMGGVQAKLAAIRTPTLVLWGALDPIVPLSSGERVAREMPRARLAVVEDAWHMPWLEQPENTAQQMLEFLDAPD